MTRRFCDLCGKRASTMDDDGEASWDTGLKDKMGDSVYVAVRFYADDDDGPAEALHTDLCPDCIKKALG